MHHLHIDVVPAIADASKHGHIWIPDRSKNDWIISGPKVHAERASAVNQRNDACFTPLVKLLKYWNQGLPSTASLRSFTIETMATRIFTPYRVRSLEEGLLKFFDFVVCFFLLGYFPLFSFSSYRRCSRASVRRR